MSDRCGRVGSRLAVSLLAGGSGRRIDRRHAARCELCSTAAERAARAHAALGSMADATVPAPPGLVPAVMAGLGREEADQPHRGRVAAVTSAVAVGVAGAVAAVIAARRGRPAPV